MSTFSPGALAPYGWSDRVATLFHSEPAASSGRPGRVTASSVVQSLSSTAAALNNHAHPRVFSQLATGSSSTAGGWLRCYPAGRAWTVGIPTPVVRTSSPPTSTSFSSRSPAIGPTPRGPSGAGHRLGERGPAGGRTDQGGPCRQRSGRRNDRSAGRGRRGCSTSAETGAGVAEVAALLVPDRTGVLLGPSAREVETYQRPARRATPSHRRRPGRRPARPPHHHLTAAAAAARRRGNHRHPWASQPRVALGGPTRPGVPRHRRAGFRLPILRLRP